MVPNLLLLKSNKRLSNFVFSMLFIFFANLEIYLPFMSFSYICWYFPYIYFCSLVYRHFEAVVWPWSYLFTCVCINSRETERLFDIYIYQGVDVVEWSRAMDVRLSEWCCSVSMVWIQIPSREEQKFDSSKI